MSKTNTVDERLAKLGTEPQRESFVFYKSFLEQLEELDGEEQAQLAIAIPRYALGRVEPTFQKGYMRAIWSGVKSQLDANWHKYLNAIKKEQSDSKPTAKAEQNDSKTIANENDNVNENENAKENARTLARGGLMALGEFELGFALFRKGYIVKAADLHAIYARAAATKSPVAYAAKAFHEADDKAKLNVAANYLEAIGCKDTRGLEIYGANLCQEGGEVLLKVRCTAAARDAIGSTGQDKAKTYLKSIGATGVSFVCNNN